MICLKKIMLPLILVGIVGFSVAAQNEATVSADELQRLRDSLKIENERLKAELAVKVLIRREGPSAIPIIGDRTTFD